MTERRKVSMPGGHVMLSTSERNCVSSACKNDEDTTIVVGLPQQMNAIASLLREQCVFPFQQKAAFLPRVVNLFYNCIFSRWRNRFIAAIFQAPGFSGVRSALKHHFRLHHCRLCRHQAYYISGCAANNEINGAFDTHSQRYCSVDW